MMENRKKPLNALEVGAQICWYRIIDVIGQGGFGVIYLAEDMNLHHEVAIKEYLPDDISVRGSNNELKPKGKHNYGKYRWGLEKFLEEARILGQFKHPNIVRMFNVIEENNTAYMVMDYEVGENLQDILRHRTTLEEEDIQSIIYPIIDGIKLVHAAGFLHRDIKPGNIFLRVDGGPVLLDFGSACSSFHEYEEEAEEVEVNIFSRSYSPIEQHYSNPDLQGPWTDIYALGATLYHVVVGRPPVDAVERSLVIGQLSKDNYVPVRQARANVEGYSQQLLTAIDYALAFCQQDRPQTISEWFSLFERAEPKNMEMGLRHDILASVEQETERGDPAAQSKLAYMYANGIAVKKDQKMALHWYMKAAEQGYINAQYNLGLIFFEGRGVAQDLEASLDWYKLAAEDGDILSQVIIGTMYTRGIGTAIDLEEAFKWYLRAAQKNHVNAQFSVAKCYFNGQGTQINKTDSFYWYKKAARQGHIASQTKLAYMYARGIGQERNDVKAVYWFRKAAEQGYPKAQYNLGVLYASGRGVKKNISLAKRWYTLALERGEQSAKQELDKLAARG